MAFELKFKVMDQERYFGHSYFQGPNIDERDWTIGILQTRFFYYHLQTIKQKQLPADF